MPSRYLPVSLVLLASTSVGVSAATRIVAAENFYGDLAAQIGGSHVQVTSILSNPDDDPHLFEASASTAEALANAQIVIYNGADYDPWMEKLLSASKKRSAATIVAADVVGAKSGDNPHLWYEPKTLPAVAKTLEADLERIDPANKADFRENLSSFEDSFAKAIADIAKIKAQHAGLVVTATEPVFGYMANALGFTMLNTAFQMAMMNNAEPSPSQVIAFEKSLSDGQAKILFYNSQVTDKTTERLLEIAKEHKAIVVGVTETEPKGKMIQTWFRGQLEEIRQDLEKH